MNSIAKNVCVLVVWFLMVGADVSLMGIHEHQIQDLRYLYRLKGIDSALQGHLAQIPAPRQNRI